MKGKVFDSVSKEMMGKEITLLGLVVNCKAGPCLKVKNDIIYVPELEYRASEIMGKKVSVTGTLLEKKLIPDPEIDESGAISTGAYGDQLVLENISKVKIL
nr:hypothetical protein [Candidatus Freyarchaeota archaeon]